MIRARIKTEKLLRRFDQLARQGKGRSEIIDIMNQEGIRSSHNKPVTWKIIQSALYLHKGASYNNYSPEQIPLVAESRAEQEHALFLSEVLLSKISKEAKRFIIDSLIK